MQKVADEIITSIANYKYVGNNILLLITKLKLDLTFNLLQFYIQIQLVHFLVSLNTVDRYHLTYIKHTALLKVESIQCNWRTIFIILI